MPLYELDKFKHKVIQDNLEIEKDRLASAVFEIKKKYKLSQFEFAVRCGLSIKAVYRIENCIGDYNLYTVSKISATFNMSFCEIFNDGKR